MISPARILRCLTMLLCTCWAASLEASGLRVSGLALGDAGDICMEIGWEHAWNHNSAPGNHDAVWLFLKWKNAAGEWQHLPLQGNGSAANATVSLQGVADGAGIFIIPAAGTQGGIAPLQICVESLSPLPDEAVELRAYAIEMVWVSDAAFWIGDGVSHQHFGAPDGQPYYVADEGEIPATALLDTGNYAPAAAIPAAWPKGKAGFYCMKYEVSQAQYCDFLNTLNYTQQSARTANSPASAVGSPALSPGPASRNEVRIAESGAAPGIPAQYVVEIGAERACNWLSWADLCAYLDWAALRPLTEMEFEKACRGPLPPLALEFAWGSDSVRDANTLLHDGLPSERSIERGDSIHGLASHGYNGPQGPLRTGFAADAQTGRVAAGAGYYGAMELSGNLWEQCVTVNAEGLQYQAVTGDGQISDGGQADASTWPSAQGAGFRGGGWNSGIIPGFRDLAISDRFYAGLAPGTRRNTSGGRGAR